MFALGITVHGLNEPRAAFHIAAFSSSSVISLPYKILLYIVPSTTVLAAFKSDR